MPQLRIAIVITAIVVLAGAQIAAALEYLLVPAPTPATSGPQNSLDEVLGLVAGPGSVVGVLSAVASGMLASRRATLQRDAAWSRAIAASGAVALLGLVIAAFVLSGAGRSPLHPIVFFIAIPIVALAYEVVGRERSSHGTSHTA